MIEKDMKFHVDLGKYVFEKLQEHYNPSKSIKNKVKFYQGYEQHIETMFAGLLFSLKGREDYLVITEHYSELLRGVRDKCYEMQSHEQSAE